MCRVAPMHTVISTERRNNIVLRFLSRIIAMNRLLFSLAVFFTFSGSPALAEGICSADARVVAPCYNVTGRLEIHANLRPRIHVDDDGGLLAIIPKSGLETGETDYHWPEAIGEMLSLENTVKGVFRVCPFTVRKAHKLKYVCIDEVFNARTEEK